MADKRICNRCRTTGVVYRPSKADPDTGKMPAETCPDCNGAGEVNWYRKLENGKIPNPPREGQ